MSFLIPPRRFDRHRPEMMDLPDADPTMLRDDLRNLRIINRHFGGLTALQKLLIPMVMRTEPERTLEILDLATGSGDHPVALARVLRGLGRSAIITAVDKNNAMLDIAHAISTGFGEIRLEQRDILVLPYPDMSFDFVTCSLAIHHFSRKDAVRILREMDRLSRVGFVINDLSRSYGAAFVVWIYTRIATTNPMTRNDSVASVLRAFTKDEIQTMAREAGVDGLVVVRKPFFRLVAAKERICAETTLL